MLYREFLPSPLLRPYVQLIWCFESDSSTEAPMTERIAPDGIVELVLYYRGRMAVRLAESAEDRQPRSSLVCQTSRFLDLTASGAVGFVSVRFLPWGALHFFDPPVHELADRIVAASDVWGKAATDLEDSLSEARSLKDRLRLVEAFLVARVRRHRKADVEEAVRAVWSRRGTFRVPELCHQLGVSDRTAQRVFHSAVGLPPKSYGRLVRFLSACALLRHSNGRGLAEMAHLSGYYDQAHFTSDFKAYSGLTPGEFLRGESISFLELE